MTLPDPCVPCRCRQRHNCRLQPVCCKVKDWVQRRSEAGLTAYSIDTMAAYRRRNNKE